MCLVCTLIPVKGCNPFLQTSGNMVLPAVLIAYYPLKYLQNLTSIFFINIELGVISLTSLHAGPNSLCPTPNFWEAFVNSKFGIWSIKSAKCSSQTSANYLICLVIHLKFAASSIIHV